MTRTPESAHMELMLVADTMHAVAKNLRAIARQAAFAQDETFKEAADSVVNATLHKTAALGIGVLKHTLDWSEQDFDESLDLKCDPEDRGFYCWTDFGNPDHRERAEALIEKLSALGQSGRGRPKNTSRSIS